MILIACVQHKCIGIAAVRSTECYDHSYISTGMLLEFSLGGGPMGAQRGVQLSRFTRILRNRGAAPVYMPPSDLLCNFLILNI